MVFGRSRFTLIFIYVILCFALCAKPISSQTNDAIREVTETLESFKTTLEGYVQSFADKKVCWKTPESAKPCCDQCQENYRAAADCAKAGIESLNNQDLPKANSDISSIPPNAQKCTDCFQETGNGGDQNIKDINNFVKENSDWCLWVIKPPENGVQSVHQNDKPVAPSLPKYDLQKFSVDRKGKEEVLPPPLPKLGSSSSFDQINDPAKQLTTLLEELRGHIDHYASWFPQKKSCWATPESAKPCCDQCQESFVAASECAKGGVESINKQDIAKAKCDITNIGTNVQKCDDCFEQSGNGGDKAVKDINTYVKDQVAYYLMAFADDGVQKLSVNQNDKLDAPSLRKIDLQKFSVDQKGKEEVLPPPLPKLRSSSSFDQVNDPAKQLTTLLEELRGHIDHYASWFPQKKSCWATPESAKPCCDQCQESFVAASECAKGGVESINKQDIAKAKCDITNIGTNVQKCDDCFEQSGNGGDKAVKDINTYVKDQVAYYLMAFADDGVQKLSFNQNDDGTKRSIEQLEGYKQYDL